MPEFVEAEAYRRTAVPLVEAEVTEVEVLDPRLLRRRDGDPIEPMLVGTRFTGARRLGKLVLLDLDSGSTLALSFGLRGRLIVDGTMASTTSRRRRSATPRPDHVRLRVTAGAHQLELEDQLRLATAELDIDEAHLGVDVMALTESDLQELLGRSAAAIKSRLMDQRVIAGIGNLLADEILFQASLGPGRASDDLGVGEREALWRAIVETRDHALRHGGSHHGEFIQSGSRELGAHCPRCGVEIERVRVGGRTTFFCPVHQPAEVE